MLHLQKWPVFGLHLLLFLHTSESFVLLTANIEDVKKLATKFVSESLADKIATFIAKAAQHVITQPSAEVQRDVSEENKYYNVKQPSSNEFRTEQKKPRKIHAKNGKNNVHLDQGQTYAHRQENGQLLRKQKTFNKMNNRDVSQTNSIENNNIDSPLIKTYNAVLDLNLNPETNQRADGVTEKEIINHKYNEYKLLATSGNMLLTKVISHKDSNEYHRYRKKSK